MSEEAMTEALEALKADYPNIEYESREYVLYGRSPEEKEVVHYITNIGGNDSVTLKVREPDDIDSLRDFLSKEAVVYKDYAGISVGGRVEVLLRPISRISAHRSRELVERSISIRIFYQGYELAVTIGTRDEESVLHYFVENVRELRFPARSALTLTIERPDSQAVTLSEQEVRKLLFSVLFDIEYSYEIALDTVKYDSLPARGYVRRASRAELPGETINLVFKNFIPELIEYFHIAERVDYLPFKYICYFHVVEYFMDKSATESPQKELKNFYLSQTSTSVLTITSGKQ